MVDSNLFRNLVEERGLKYSYIASRLGLSKAGLHKKISGETEFKASEIMAITDILQLTEKTRDNIFFNNKVI